MTALRNWVDTAIYN